MEDKIKIALDTNTVLNFSEYLDTYSNGEITNIDINKMLRLKLIYVNKFTILMQDFFHNPIVKSIFYKDNTSIFANRILPNYYDINEMYVDMLQSDTLKESQKDVVFQLMKDNYKQFTKHYPNLLIKYDTTTHKKIDSSSIEFKINWLIEKCKKPYKTIVEKINDLSTSTEVARMFKLGLGQNSKYEFVITSYVEKEIFTHISNSIEYKVADAELKRQEELNKSKKNNSDKINTISVFNETTVRKILRQCSLVMFSEKASQRVENLGKKLAEEKIDKESGKKIKGVDKTQNKLGDSGDPNCVASAQCLGLTFVSSNIKDLRNLGLDISAQDYSKLAKQYVEEKRKIVPLAQDHTFVSINPQPKLDTIIKSTFEKLQENIDNSIQKNIQQTIAEETCTSMYGTRMDSAVYAPMELVEHSDNNDIIEKDTLFGLQQPQLIQSTIHKVEVNDDVDEREYNKIYNTDTHNYDNMTDEEKRRLEEKNNLSNTIGVQQGNQYNTGVGYNNTTQDNNCNIPDNDGGMQYNR